MKKSNKAYYHCYYCNNFPSVKLFANQVKIPCPVKHAATISFYDFCTKCIKECQCENCIVYKNGQFNKCNKCNICSPKMNKFCDNKYLQFSFNNSNPNILNYNALLQNFIFEISPVIEETQKIINRMKYELYIYQNLLTTERKFINNISISNLMNLEIFKDIDSKAKDFIKRMKGIDGILNNFHNFKYNNKEEGYNKCDLEEKTDYNDFFTTS